jgi:AhpD family alkylhydroperoxidase
MTQRLAYETASPEGVKALGAVYAWVLRSGLEKPLIDLAFLRASQVNGCAYCIDMHTQDALKDGMDVEKLMLVAVWREAGGYFTAREQAALAWAEVVTRIADTHAPDEAFAAAREQFNEEDLANLTIAIGLINVYNRLAISFRKPPVSLARLATIS